MYIYIYIYIYIHIYKYKYRSLSMDAPGWPGFVLKAHIISYHAPLGSRAFKDLIESNKEEEKDVVHDLLVNNLGQIHAIHACRGTHRCITEEEGGVLKQKKVARMIKKKKMARADARDTPVPRR